MVAPWWRVDFLQPLDHVSRCSGPLVVICEIHNRTGKCFELTSGSYRYTRVDADTHCDVGVDSADLLPSMVSHEKKTAAKRRTLRSLPTFFNGRLWAMKVRTVQLNGFT